MVKMEKIDPRKLFRPKQAIRTKNQEFFTGRCSLLAKCLDSISVQGSALVLYGDRGVGKTSVAWQMAEILRGNHKLMTRLKIEPKLDVAEHDCVWVDCRRDLGTIEGVLAELLLAEGATSLMALHPKLFRKGERLKLGNESAKVKKSAFEIHEHGGSDVAAEEIGAARDTIHRIFHNVMKRIADERETPLLFFFDEFDRLPDKRGIGDLIKSTDAARFVVIGVADDVAEIVDDHESTERKLAGSQLRVPAMNHREVRDVLDRAERVYPGRLRFEESFRKTMCEECSGLPSIVQRMGFFAVYNHPKPYAEEMVLDRGSFHRALDSLFSQEVDVGDPSIDDRQIQQLGASVGKSKVRLQILNVLASQPPNWVAMKQFRKSLPISARHDLDANLEVLATGAVIARKQALVRFRDPMMRIVVRMMWRRTGRPHQ